MKFLIIAAIVLVVVVQAESNEESVLQLLNDLKHNAELEVAGMDLAWERRLKGKQDLADSLNQSLINQRAECQNKDNDVKQKIDDIAATSSYINWMLFRQRSNSNRITILEANICSLTNNFVNDIRNYKIVLSLITFLRQELSRIEGTGSLAEINRFNSQVSKFMKLYTTGKLINMVQKIEIQNGELIIPDIHSDMEVDEQELIQRLKPTILTQLHQNDNSDQLDQSDSAVVLIPGCDDQVGTVVVVQNDDGTSDNDDDFKITYHNNPTKPTPTPHTDPRPHHKHEDPKVEDDVLDLSEEESIASEESIPVEQGEEELISTGDESASEEEVVEGELFSESEEESKAEDDDNNDDDNHTEEDNHNEEDNHGEEDNHNEEDTKKEDTKTKPTEEEEDYPNTPEGFKKLLDALEKHTKASIELAYTDEVRSSLGFVDFKLHIELENETFDKNINYEKDYQSKQNNQLTGRQQASILCNSRLNQLQVAYKIALSDIDAATLFYQEQRKIKVEEVNTFDDVYRIYVNQVNQ